MSHTISIIRERLTQALNPNHLEIIDESAQHKGHAGAQNGAGHYFVRISSPQFQNDDTLHNHRLVYQALENLIPSMVHAIRIQTTLD